MSELYVILRTPNISFLLQALLENFSSVWLCQQSAWFGFLAVVRRLFVRRA